MAVGTILTLDADRKVVVRTPIWPWPAPSEYPRDLPNGHLQVFRPIPYYNFPLREQLL